MRGSVTLNTGKEDLIIVYSHLKGILRVPTNRSLTTVGLLCCLVPIGTVIICATWSMQSGLATVCFPLIDGCLSISAACRPKPVVYLFRTMMLPMSVLLIGFWIQNDYILKHSLPMQAVRRRWIFLLSVTGSLFLILYVLYLGTEGPMYAFLRRIGVYIFFGGTGVAQLLTTLHIRSIALSSNKAPQQTVATLISWKLQWVIVLFMLTAGPLNLLFKQVLQDATRIENVIEWNFGLAMFCWYGLHTLITRRIAAQLPQRG